MNWSRTSCMSCLSCLCLLLSVAASTTSQATAAAPAATAAAAAAGLTDTPAVPAASPAPAAAAASSSVPSHPIFSHPWVQQNVALTYAPETTRDGLGAQALRMLGIYALSKTLGLKYLHTGPECVGHIGGLPHYQGRNCSSRMTAADFVQLARVQRFLSLPTTQGVTSAALSSSSSSSSSGSRNNDSSSWHVERLDDIMLTWQHLRKAAEAALQQRRPTVIKLARVQALLCQNPDIFLAVPQLQPPAELGQERRSKPWLLDSIRMAVHMRRGDITRNVRHLNRILPLSYYANILQQLTQALEALGHDVVIECFTEHATSRSDRRALTALKRAFPSLNILVDTDDLWNWQQISTADVIVQSLSTYSVVPSLLNPSALVIGPQAAGLDGKAISLLQTRHWVSVLDHNGTLPEAVQQQLRQRFGVVSRGGGAALQTQQRRQQRDNGLQQQIQGHKPQQNKQGVKQKQQQAAKQKQQKQQPQKQQRKRHKLQPGGQP